MRRIELAARSAVFVAAAAAASSTWHAFDAWPPRSVWDDEPWFHAVNAASGWLVAAVAMGVGSRRTVWAGWAAGFAGLGAVTLAIATVNAGAFGSAALHGVTALLLLPTALFRLRGWSAVADLPQHPLRWATLLVAGLAGAAANLSAAFYSETDDATGWGPWLYVHLAWITSMLALTAWMPKPWRVRGLVVGGVASLVWIIIMIPTPFLLNMTGHGLAALFFFATARDERGVDADQAPRRRAPGAEE